MKIIAPLLAAFLLLPLHAAEGPKESVQPSPDAKYQAVITGGDELDHHLEIRDSATGEVLFRPAADASGNDSPFDPAHLLWSPDSRVLAAAFGTGHFETTRLFLSNGRTFTEIPCPSLDGHYDNAHILPVRWRRGHRLSFHVDGPHAGKNDGHYEGSLDIQVDLKSATAKYLNQKIIDDADEDGTPPQEKQAPLLEVSEIAPGPANPADPNPAPPGLLVKASRFPGDDRPSAQFILPGLLGHENLLVSPRREAAAALFLKSDDSRALAYATGFGSQRSIHVLALTAAGGFRLCPAVESSAAARIPLTKLGKQIFPGGGLEFASPSVESLTATTITLSTAVSPATLGGATKTLTCTLKLLPDATVKLLDWHLSGK